ncbi:MAG: helix-turn-helix domain-containing protein [Desulfobaccales bacterium]
MDKNLTIMEAAAFLGVSHHSLRRYVALREIPFIRVGKRLIRFSQKSLEEYLAHQTVAVRRQEGK